jgi:type IV pilus assembly protein PilM
MLAKVQKPYQTFEAEYEKKHPGDVAGRKKGDELLDPKYLTQEDLNYRLDALDKEIRAMPDIFPLQPNTPRVSDVLAWLSTHPQVVCKGDQLSFNGAKQLPQIIAQAAPPKPKNAPQIEETEEATPEEEEMGCQPLQIDNFNYSMVKRPDLNKKGEKYQVKIEIEFTSPSPKQAREFHNALIAPNDFVDPKSEVKWSSTRGKYSTTFYLKDKTYYPSGKE